MPVRNCSATICAGGRGMAGVLQPATTCSNSSRDRPNTPAASLLLLRIPLALLLSHVLVSTPTNVAGKALQTIKSGTKPHKCPSSVEAARSKLAGLGEPDGPCSAGGADGPMRRAPPAAAVPASRAAVAVKVAARAVSSCSSVGPARGPRGHGPSTSTGRAPAASAQRSSGRNQPRSEPPGVRTTRPAAAAGPNVAGDRQDPAGRPAHTGRQRPQQPGDAVGQQDVPQQQPGDPVARGDWCPRQSWTVPRAEYGPTAQGGRPWPGAG